VPANPNIGEVGAGGPIDTRCTWKADGKGVPMFHKVRHYQQSIMAIVQYQRAVPLGQVLYRSTETTDRRLTTVGLPTVVGCLSEPGGEGVKADSTNP